MGESERADEGRFGEVLWITGLEIKEVDGFGMNHVFSSSITFRDHFNRYWTRDARGTLVKEKDNVIKKKRNIYRPYMSTFFRKINK